MRQIMMILACTTMLFGNRAMAQIDGSRTSAGDAYGPAVAVQLTQTGFGDTTGIPSGSELDAAYAYDDGTNLYLMFTGNLDNSFHNLNIFIDSIPGAGENTITADTGSGGNNPTNDGWANKYAGLTFDAGFSPDFLLIARNGSDINGNQFNLDFCSVGNDSVVEAIIDVFGGTYTGSNGMLPNGILVGFDNDNLGGVSGGSMAADQTAALAVTTGVELSIPLVAIGASAGDTILISAQINSASHDFLSNQTLSGLEPNQGNLGGDGMGGSTGNLSGIDFNDFPADQYFTVTIMPSGATEVTPDSYSVTRGQYVSGNVGDLADSDNNDLSLRRLGTDTQSRTEFEVIGNSPTTNPSTFEFTLEGAVFARSNVVQTIELFDYVVQAWELVDTSDAARSPAPDSVVTVVPTGDLSRFVDPATSTIEARIRYKSDSPRQNFASNIDQTIWTVE